MPEPSAFDVETTTDKVQCHASPGIYQIRAVEIKVWGKKRN